MRNATITKKITVVFGVILTVSTITTGVGLWHLKEVESSTKELMEVPLAKERIVSDWYRIVYGGSRRTLAIAKSEDKSLVQFFAEDAANSTKEVSGILKKVEALLT